jgi:N-acetylneuraminic acid mutarotase
MKIKFYVTSFFIIFMHLNICSLIGQTTIQGVLQIDSVKTKNKAGHILFTDNNYVFKRSIAEINIPSSVLVLSQNEMDTALMNNNYLKTYRLSSKLYSKGNNTTKYGEWQQYKNLPLEPSLRTHHTAIWTGSNMIIYGGLSASNAVLNDGGIFDNSTNTWSVLGNSNSPGPRIHHTAIWTGSKMIIWGGAITNQSFSTPASDILNTGAIYDPQTNAWTPMSLTNAPSARLNHTAIWTGTEMIIWGGQDGNRIGLNTGAKYNPNTNTWTTVTTTNAAIKRSNHTAVWTGTEMIVWGGYENVSVAPISILNDGKKYNPVTNTWAPIALNNKLDIRYDHGAVWTGSKMIIWGGWSDYDGVKAYFGGSYDPSSNTWSDVAMENAPFGIEYSKLFWTGSDIIFTGEFYTLSTENYPIKKYNLASNKWVNCNEKNIHKGTWFCNGIWTGSELILWGGQDSNGTNVSGISKYYPTLEGLGYNKNEKLFAYKKLP